MSSVERELGKLNAEIESLVEFRAWATPKLEMVTWAMGAAVGIGAMLGVLATLGGLYLQSKGIPVPGK